MTATQTPAPASGDVATRAAESLTPDARQWWQRARGWVWGFVILLLVGALTIATYGGVNVNSQRFLDPTSPSPAGTKALVETINSHGVPFTHAESRDDLDAALGNINGTATVVVEDPNGVLDVAAWADLHSIGAERIVVIDSSASADGLTERVAQFEGVYAARSDEDGNVVAADMPATLTAGNCADPLAQNAPEISNLGGQEYVPTAGAAGCYQVRDGYALVVGESDGVEIAVLGAATNLTNAYIAEDANAAMAIALLASHDELVWYTASFADTADAGPTFGSYIPQWLLPVTLGLFVVGGALVFWRGRRFGPLVTERLPVTVPAGETLEGRARLYDAGSSRLRTLDSIRVGTLTRLADLTGLGPNASTPDLVAATAGLAGVPREHAHGVLLDGNPETDAELVELANAVAELERRVRAATGRTKPETTSTPDDSPRGDLNDR